jgi:hypothetical protein
LGEVGRTAAVVTGHDVSVRLSLYQVLETNRAVAVGCRPLRSVQMMPCESDNTQEPMTRLYMTPPNRSEKMS